MIPTLAYVFLKEKNSKVRLKLMGPIINCSMQFFKYTIIIWRRKEIQEGLHAIRHDWIQATEEERLIFRSKMKIGRRVVLIAAFTMYGGGLCYRTILPLLKGTVITADNITIRPLPCPSYFIIINEQQSPIYEILFVLQVMAGMAIYAVISGTCGISALLVLHACSMLRILVNKIKKLVNKSDMSEVTLQRKIMDIVEYQMKIKRFLKNIETVTEYICLIEMIGGTCLMCLVGYCILMELENTNTMAVVVYITLQISIIFCVFILCYIGQMLVDENYIVSQASSTINWYRLSIKNMRCLILIIAMSNYPMKLKAAKMMEMSLTTFTDVMKMSMGYLNILREVI
ncbi:odorant receptor 4 [Apis mellifera carnica]|uniref:Odorant receptor n=1 Tax=Apis mellifera TaxID=7460 RepID=A0A7M7GEK9_APIME|nr:odorant receptor 4 [Apis mellifera]KAG9435126.1 odorant receptor 4 [Apis mellifera carnica]|eukprot:XP_003250767.2 odorant receptor 4 [Apis mellifera]